MAPALAPDAWLLDDAFDPAKATVAYLRSACLQSDVPAPAAAKKADLVRLYNTQVKPRVPALRSGRSGAGSARGIKDMRGAPSSSINVVHSDERERASSESATDDADAMEVDAAPRARTKAARPAKGKGVRLPRSRSASVLDSDDETPDPRERKRPRVKSRGKAKEASPAVEPEPIDELDEMDVDEDPARKPSLGGKGTPARHSDAKPRASVEGRRRSSGLHRSDESDASGFSSFNPFQEGSDRKKRKSSLGFPPPAADHIEPEPDHHIERKPSPLAAGSSSPRRKSLSALQDPAPSSAARSATKPRATIGGGGGGALPSSASVPTFQRYMVPVEQLTAPHGPYREMVRRIDAEAASSSSPERAAPPPATKERRSSLTAGRPAKPESGTDSRQLVKQTSVVLQKLPSRQQQARRISLAGLFTVLVAYAGLWRQERLDIGYCDPNAAVNGRQLARTSKLGPLAPTCMPCPPHGRCADGALVACEPDYVRSPSLLSLGGTLPVADHCVPDTEKLRRVADQAGVIAGTLRTYRGLVECGSRPPTLPAPRHAHGRPAPPAWQLYGVAEAELKKSLAGVRPDRVSEEAFEQYFHLAINDLLRHGDIGSGMADDETVYYAATAGDLPLSCRAQRAAWGAADDNKGSLSLLLSAVAAYYYGKARWRRSKKEREQVRELVDVALERLQQQQFFHYRDSALTPVGHIAPVQLRDDILDFEHSLAARQKLWQRVERVIDGNANVRRTDADYRGEPTTCWEWIGPMAHADDGEGRQSRRQSRGPRVSFAPQPQSESLYPSL